MVQRKHGGGRRGDARAISAHQLSRVLEVQYKTAWFLACRIREAMRFGDLTPFGGNGGAADETAAKEHALEGARDLVCMTIRETGNVNLDHRIEVTNDQQEPVLTVTFRDAFTITG